MPEKTDRRWEHEIERFKMTQRNLPHWELPGALYHLRSRTKDGRVLSDQDRTIVFDAMKYLGESKYEMHAAVVMPDHFHLIVHPLESSSGK